MLWRRRVEGTHGDGCGEPEDRKTDDEEGRVETLLGHNCVSEGDGFRDKAVDGGESLWCGSINWEEGGEEGTYADEEADGD